MSVPSFKQAVKIAKCIIAPEIKDERQYDRKNLTGLAAARASVYDLSTEEGYREYRAEHCAAESLLESPERLLEFARTDYFSFIALRRGVADLLELDWNLPKNLRTWLFNYLRGDWTPPKRPRGQPRKDARSMKTYHAVLYLVDVGVTASRDQDNIDGESACDAVARAHLELGMQPDSYSCIKNIYFKEKAKDLELGENDVPSPRIILSPDLAELIKNT